jgi:NAD(P)H dehydrogenase (quinone)
MILVTGAGGKTGKAVIRALASRGEAVRAFVHRAEQDTPVTHAGAQTVSVGDLQDETALALAAQGAQAIYHICPNVTPLEVPIGRAVMTAAVRSGVRRFVYHSVLHPQIEAMPHHWDKLRVEEMLLAADFDLTVLQPTAYMQNLLASWTSIVEQGVYRVPYPPATRLSLVDLDDVAAAAALVLTASGHGGATYELVGTAPLDQHEVAETLARALGRPVRAEQQTIADWNTQARASRMGDDQREILIKMFSHYERHGLIGNANVLRWLLGREPATLLDFARREHTR